MQYLPHNVDNAYVKCKITPVSNEQALYEVGLCGPNLQDKPANVSAELHSSSA